MDDRNPCWSDGADAQVGRVRKSKAAHDPLIESVKLVGLFKKGAELFAFAEKKCGGVALESAIPLRRQTGLLKVFH